MTRHVMSRSVITPTARIDSRLSTTGISPQSHSVIIRATSCSDVVGVQQAGFLVINLLTSIVIPLSVLITLRNPLSFDGFQPLSVSKLVQQRHARVWPAGTIEK